MLVLMLLGSGASVACAPDDPVDWAEGACADFAREVSGDLDPRSFPEPSTIGEMRGLLVDSGARAPSEWRDLDDDDLVAQCTYQLAADAPEEDLVECPDGVQPGERRVSYLVDERGQGVFLGSTC